METSTLILVGGGAVAWSIYDRAAKREASPEYQAQLRKYSKRSTAESVGTVVSSLGVIGGAITGVVAAVEGLWDGGDKAPADPEDAPPPRDAPAASGAPSWLPLALVVGAVYLVGRSS